MMTSQTLLHSYSCDLLDYGAKAQSRLRLRQLDCSLDICEVRWPLVARIAKLKNQDLVILQKSRQTNGSKTKRGEPWIIIKLNNQ